MTQSLMLQDNTQDVCTVRVCVPACFLLSLAFDLSIFSPQRSVSCSFVYCDKFESEMTTELYKY